MKVQKPKTKIKPFKAKVGTEIEAWVFDREGILKGDKIASNARLFPSILRQSFKKKSKYLYYKKDAFHWDGGTTEVALKPCENMEEYYLCLKEALSQIYDICDKKDFYYIHNGIDSSRGSGAGAHTHISGLDTYEIRDRLWTYQPFIALLSQNSPMGVHVLNSERKDSRLIGGGWAGYSNGHDGSALSTDSDFDTIEVRIPSDTTLIHMVAIASFIKACSFIEHGIFKFSNTSCQRSYSKVMRIGTDLPILIVLDTPTKLFGYEKNRIPIPINTLFSILVNTGELHESLHLVLDELPSNIRYKVWDFYKIVSDGYTISDYLFDYFSKWFAREYPDYYDLYKDLPSISLLASSLPFGRTDDHIKTSKSEMKRARDLEFIELLHNIGNKSYTQSIPFWEQLPKPENRRFNRYGEDIVKHTLTNYDSTKIIIPDSIKREEAVLKCLESDSQFIRTWSKH